MTDLRQMANAVRFLSIDAIERAGYGHGGSPLSGAELATALFARHLRYNPTVPRWFDRDRFVLSNGHSSMLLYSLLHLSGYARISLDEIRSFHEFHSACHGHPERDLDSGIELTTGPLGQGVAHAVGMAVAEAFLRSWFGPELVDHRTYAIVGDGCLQEGVGQEIISLAGHLRLGRLTVLWDANGATADDLIGESQSDDVPERFRHSGWHVQDVDGHDPEAVSTALEIARQDRRPSMIACHTIIGRGIPRLQGQAAAHSARIQPEDSRAARESLGWPYGPFEVPPKIRADWRAAGERSAAEYAAWQKRVEAAPAEQRRQLERLLAGRMPENWEQPLRAWRDEAATKGFNQNGIKSSSEIAALVSDVIPELIVGSADLNGTIKHRGRLAAFGAGNEGGRYIAFGIREHAMAAMMSGMSAHGGVRPLGTTFLAFSDYQRPAIRMAALMRMPVLFVLSHDSIGVGKLGPTHQPVEHLAALRAVPNLLVLRPADAVEMAECWEAALAYRHGPSVIVLSRQPQAPVRGEGTPNEVGGGNRSVRGAYVLTEATDGPRRVTLLATGSEVAIALAARAMLQAEGIPTAVVSMPCWELFDRQDAAYRTAVIPPSTVRVGVEAAVRLGWDHWIGENGGFVGMTSFGASGPEAKLFDYFGITPERVAEEARRRL